MKIQCNVCESSEANVLCCADEAALCWACDLKVHTANKLASKHQRVPLSTSSSHMPKCDICQERFGYFFCIEDRALLCRECDVAVHTANPLVSAHQRFLLTGVKVGLEAAEPGPSSSSGKNFQSHPENEKITEQENHSVPVSSNIGPPKKDNDDTNKNIISLPVQKSGNEELSSSKVPFSGGGGVPQWAQLDDLFGLDDFSHSYNYINNTSSSKGDNGKLGDSDSSPSLRTAVGELDTENSTGFVQDSFWAVPEIIPSPPTASGLRWPKNYNDLSSDCPVFVPDVSSSPLANLYSHRDWSRANTQKRRRHF